MSESQHGAVVKPESREETVLRQYRHERTVVDEETAKLERMEVKRRELDKQIEAKRAALKAHKDTLAELRAEAGAILAELTGDAE
jgi:hypothetical protein